MRRILPLRRMARWGEDRWAAGDTLSRRPHSFGQADPSSGSAGAQHASSTVVGPLRKPGADGAVLRMRETDGHHLPPGTPIDAAAWREGERQRDSPPSGPRESLHSPRRQQFHPGARRAGATSSSCEPSLRCGGAFAQGLGASSIEDIATPDTSRTPHRELPVFRPYIESDARRRVGYAVRRHHYGWPQCGHELLRQCLLVQSSTLNWLEVSGPSCGGAQGLGNHARCAV